mgnify:CR=1 FL=1
MNLNTSKKCSHKILYYVFDANVEVTAKYFFLFSTKLFQYSTDILKLVFMRHFGNIIQIIW